MLNCRDLPHVLNVLFMWKVNFEKKKKPVLLIEKFPSLATKECDNATTFYYPVFAIFCQVVAYGRLRTKENFKVLALQVVAVTYERWSLTRGSKYGDSVDLETFGILENWSLRRGGRLREVVATGRFDCIWKGLMFIRILNQHVKSVTLSFTMWNTKLFYMTS